MHAILNRVYDIEPTLAVPDYHLAARDVMRHLRRRALVILLTNLRDEDDETLLPALKLLRTRHLVVLASLREAIISRALSARVDSFDRAVTHAAAADYLAAARAGLPPHRRGRGGVPGRGARAPGDLPGQPLPGTEARRPPLKPQ